MTKTIAERFWGKVDLTHKEGCWHWTGSLHHNGYGQLNLGRSSSKSGRAHRISWEIHNGEIPEGLLVLHKCDVRSCVNPDHLYLGTPAENMTDMIAKGRAKHPRKLSSSDAATIRNAALSQKELATMFGISQAYVSQIRSGVYRAEN